MHTDKARAEFEAWYRDRFPMAERMIQAGSGIWITHRDEMEECWLASRRELVIELPEERQEDGLLDKHDMQAAMAANQMLYECREAVTASGAKVKS